VRRLGSQIPDLEIYVRLELPLERDIWKAIPQMRAHKTKTKHRPLKSFNFKCEKKKGDLRGISPAILIHAALKPTPKKPIWIPGFLVVSPMRAHFSCKLDSTDLTEKT